MSTQSDIKSTIKNAMIYAAATVLEKAAGFLMLPFYAHLLGSEGYGIIGMIEVAVGVLGVVVSYGTGSALYYFYFAKKTEADRRIFVSTTNLVQLFLVCVLLLTCHLTEQTDCPIYFWGRRTPNIYRAGGHHLHAGYNRFNRADVSFDPTKIGVRFRSFIFKIHCGVITEYLPACDSASWGSRRAVFEYHYGRGFCTFFS